MTAPGAGAESGPGTGVPAAEPEPTPGDLGRLDLCAELASARAELREYVRRGDREMADLLGAWIDTLLDEWNRRQA